MKHTHMIRYSILLALGLASVATVNTANKAQAKNYNYRVVTVTKSPYAIVYDSTVRKYTGEHLHSIAIGTATRLLLSMELFIIKYPRMNGCVVKT
ncbi:hypothetical protein GYW21_10140 [Lactobacillus mellis]|nr:hypothetical protein [Bombilactobacillus mellis]